MPFSDSSYPPSTLPDSFRGPSNIEKPRVTWDVIPEEYWKKSREAQEFLQGIAFHNHRFNAIDFIIGEMKKVRSLDVGCGPRGLGTEANIDIAYPGIDHKNFQIMDAHHLSFPDDSFEAVSLVEVIEHVENPTQVLREIYRVLEKDGILYLTTPNPSHLSHFFRHLRNKRMVIHCDHLHTWYWEMLAWMIHNVGFRDIEVYFWGDSDSVLKDGKMIKPYRSYRLGNLLYRLGFRSPVLNLCMFIKCRK